MKTRFKSILKKYEVSQQEVADRLGITTQSLGIRMSKNPTYESLKEISNAIGCSICELVDESKKIQLIIDNELYNFYSLKELEDFIKNKGSV